MTPRSLRAQAGSLHEVEAWFAREGVPLFSLRYRPGQEAIRLMIGVLLVVGAFGMTVLPFLGLGTWSTAIAPAVVILAVLPLLRLLAAMYSGRGVFGRGWRSVVALSWRVAYLGGLVWLVVAVPRLHRYEWFDFVVTVGLLLSVSAVQNAAGSALRTPACDRRAVKAVLLLAAICALAAVLLFTGWQVDLPLSALMAPLVGLLLAVSCGAVRALRPGAAGPPAAGWRSAVPTTAAPLAVTAWVLVVLAPYLYSDGRWRITSLVFAVFGVVLLGLAGMVVLWLRFRQGPGAMLASLPDWLSFTTLAVLAALGYPLVVYVFGPNAGPNDLRGAGEALALNVAYVLTASVVAVLGVHSVVAWTVQQPLLMVLSSVRSLIHGLGVVLVLLVLFGVTADVWQVATAEGIGRFGAMIGLLAGMTVLLLMYGSIQELGDCASFDSAASVRASVADFGHEPPATGHVHSIFCTIADGFELPPDVARPGRVARLNALVVMLVYQGIRLLYVGALSTGFFAVLGWVAGTPRVLHVWQVDALTGPDDRWYDRPWLRMAVLLGAVAVLYVAAHSVYDADMHEKFFVDVRGRMRRRFAVRIAYLRHVGGERPARGAPADVPAAIRYEGAGWGGGPAGADAG